VPRLLAETPGVPWEFHGHCNSGLGPLNAIEAVRAGIGTIHTAVPPLADGSSQPSAPVLVRNLRELGYDVDVDLEPLGRVERTLDAIAAMEGLPRGAPAPYRVDHYLHQVPRGMISNLRHQLAGAGLADRLPEVLEEIVRVRAEFGYPIMVTPLSQFVGSQAAVNVMTGARYEVVTDASIEYALGLHGGEEAVGGMDPDVRDRILSRPRAAVVAAQRAEPLPDLATIRRRLGPGVPDEDLILLAIMGDDALAGIPTFAELDLDRPEPDPPLLAAVRAALETGGPRGVSIATDGLRIRVERTEVGAR
jgi:oxaloacetate decarboxylase alpha subunit